MDTEHTITERHNPSVRAAATYSVVIPAWNESAQLRQTLIAVKNAQSAQELFGEIIVVDNNSTDDTASIAASEGATVVSEPINQIARARNTGARASNSAYLVFIDADTSINPTILALTLDALNNGKVIGGGSTVAVDKKITGAAKHLLNGWNWWSVRIKAAAGCYLFCTREAFETVGGFDEKQYAAEELVLSKRLRTLGRLRSQKFVIFDKAPVITSARKLDWYSTRQKLTQLLILLLPGSTRSKKMCAMWYDRNHIKTNND